MAYYTIAHFLQGDIYGSQPGSGHLKPEELSDEFWDFIFFKNTPLPKQLEAKSELMHRMRREFHYWYPVDMRSSGKDLIPNHLTYYLYDHCAVWSDDPKMWPVSIRANGHLLLNSEKVEIF